jgi:hypothetical protein
MGKKNPRGSPGTKRTAQPKQTHLALLLWGAAIVVAAAGIFWLPWILSPTVPSSGDSYVLGFNNRVAIIAFALAILLATAARFFGSGPRHAYQWLADAPRLFPPWKDAWIEYSILIGIILIKCGLVWFWSLYLVDISWCEARMFVYDLNLLAMGQVPYRDFMFIYGPATLYVPYWLCQISGGALSSEQCYACVYLLFDAAGFVGIFIFLRSLEIDKSVRWLVLLVCVALWTVTSLGLQYTVIRPFAVPATLIMLDFVTRRQSGSGAAGLVAVGMAATAAAAVCLSVSPDIGTAGAAGVAGYGLALWLRRSILQALVCWAGAIFTFAATLAVFPDYLKSILDISSGANTFPVYPSFHNLLMVAVVLLILPALITSALCNPTETRAPLALALAIGGGMMLPAAFSRCDPGHIFNNSTIPVLMMFPAMLAVGKVAFRVWTAVYVIAFPLFTQVTYWMPSGYLGNFKIGIQQHQFYRQHPQIVASWKAKWDALLASCPDGKKLHWSNVLPFPEDLDQFTSQGTMVLTAGSEWSAAIARYLLLQRKPPFEYYDAFSLGAVTPSEIQKKIQQESAYPFLLVPLSALGPLGGRIDMDAYRKSEDAALSSMIRFPVDSVPKHLPYFPDTEFIRQMLNYYKPVARYQSYFIFAKRDWSPAGGQPSSP